jgi:hypothetical protein
MPPRPVPRRHLSDRAAARKGGILALAAHAALGALVPAAALVSLAATLVKSPDRNAPPPAPGFPIPIPRPVDYRPRWGSTIAVDLDRDGRGELLASVPSGHLFLIGSEGRVPGWPPSLADLPAPAYPVGQPGIGDLDGDGQDEVVVCVNAGSAPRRAVLLAWHRDGRRVDGWPREIPTLDPRAACSPGGTLVADLDRDGRAEVAQAIAPSEIWLYDGGGLPLPGWPFRPPPRASGVAPAINARPAAADLEGDGRLEVIAVESGLGPLLHAITLEGGEAPFYPRFLPEVVDHQAPAAGDLDGDGIEEIVQSTLPASSDFLRPPGIGPSRLSLPVSPVEAVPVGTAGADPAPPPPLPEEAPGALHSLRRDGGEATGWPVPLSAGAMWGAIVVDLDGDGRAEVLQGDGDTLHGFDAQGRALKGFPLTMRRLFTRAASRIDSMWVVGDLDRDGEVDFVRALGRMDPDATELRIAAIRQRAGAPVPGTPWTVAGLIPASDPALVDLTGDGRPEVAVLAVDGTWGGWRLMAWDVAAGSRGGAGIRADTLRGMGITLTAPPR